MDEPFDELMGPPPAARKKALQTNYEAAAPAIISPEPSPVYASRSTSGPPSSAFSGRSSGPPSSAFAGRSAGPPTTTFSKNTPERWSQYERDEAQLRQDSQAATGTAVLSAAERAANRLASLHDISSLESAGASLPHPEELKAGRSSGKGFSFASNRKSKRASEEEIVYQTHDRVRAEALKVLEMADGMSPSVRKTSTGGFTTEPEPQRRVPSKLAGLSGFTSNRPSQASRASESSAQDRRWTIDDMDDDADGVDVVKMDGRNASSMTDSSEKSAWSSRYSVNQSLMELTTGGYSDTKKYLDSMDEKEQSRMDKSARNMFRTSPHQARQSPKIFGNGFTFTGKNVFGRKEKMDPKNVNLQTVWMDVDLQSNGRSLPSPTQHRGPQTIENARKRRRICIGVIVSAILVGIIATVVGTTVPRGTGTAASIIDPNDIKFYVTADVPYDAGQEEKIIRDLESLPGDADFVVHLGNIQDAAVTLCPQTAYISARAILRTSPVPVFALPGPNDWNNCPSPSTSLGDWQDNLGYFERNFVHSFGVTHQLGNEENFGFLTKGVLFVGLHLVGGRKHDKEAWRVRHAKNVRWVEEQIATVPQEKYRALVFLANARPSQQHDDFFVEIFADINSLGKPVLYIHANAGSGGFEQYQPFKESSNLIAVQVQSGGSNPPLRVAVGEGNNPFVFGS
jgi:hypothetical protein